MLILFPSLACFVIVIVGMTSVSRLTLWIFAFSFQFSMFQCNFVCVLVVFFVRSHWHSVWSFRALSHIFGFFILCNETVFSSLLQNSLYLFMSIRNSSQDFVLFFLLLLFLRGLTGKMHKNCNLKRNSMHGKHKTKLQNNIQHIRNWNCLFQ